MFMVFLLSILGTSAFNGGRNYQECKAQGFKPKSCWEAEQLNKAAVFGCKIQGKKFIGNTEDDNNGCSK
jgi:hypothetical protein